VLTAHHAEILQLKLVILMMLLHGKQLVLKSPL
jgi:hypothetical protein